jgi:hypothetical protein
MVNVLTYPCSPFHQSKKQEKKVDSWRLTSTEQHKPMKNRSKELLTSTAYMRKTNSHKLTGNPTASG